MAQTVRAVGVGVIGCGTVGGAFARTLLADRERLARATGLDFSLRRILVRDAARERPGIPRDLLTTRLEDLLVPDVHVVVEVAGGGETTYALLTRVLEAGKHLVTANKVVVSEHGDGLMDLARRRRRWVGFEASVAAGIPILRSLQDALAGTPVTRLVGILNGTTNYILTRMEEHGEDPAVALARAQREGFAEADPSLDLEGRDAAQKACILATLLTRQVVRPRDVPTEGIRAVTSQDVAAARRFHRVIRLLAVLSCEGGALEVRVHPTLVPDRHPLAAVRDQQNAVWLDGPLSGPMMLSGLGAGPGPTTSALIGDLVDIGWHLDVFDAAAPPWRSEGGYRLLPPGEARTASYLRFQVADQAGVIGEVTTTLGAHGISIASVHAGLERSAPGEGVLEILTEEGRESDLVQALAACERLPQVLGGARRIRCL